MERNYELLKEVLSVPTKTYQEERMVQFITNWLTENNIPFYVDEMFNIYATKQTDEKKRAAAAAATKFRWGCHRQLTALCHFHPSVRPSVRVRVCVCA